MSDNNDTVLTDCSRSTELGRDPLLNYLLILQIKYFQYVMERVI